MLVGRDIFQYIILAFVLKERGKLLQTSVYVVKMDFVSSLPSPDRIWDSPSLLSSGHCGLFFSGVKQSKREADHSPPFNAEFKSAWSYIPIHIRLLGVVLN